MAMMNLNKKLNNNLTLRKFKSKGNGKAKRRLLVIFLLLTLTIGLPGIASAYFVRETIAGAKIISEGAKQENLDVVKTGINKTKSAVDKLNLSLKFLTWLRVAPFIGGYISDVSHFVSAASYELSAGQKIVLILEPYKDELGFTGSPTPGQDKIAQVVKILDKTLPHVDSIEDDLKRAGEEVKSIDAGKYPEEFKGKRVKDLVETARNFIIGADVAISEGKDALLIAPKTLGQDSPKNYLILFQNDKEIRPTGGFITAFAFLTLDKGHLSTTTSDDIYRLDEKLLKVCEKKICPLSPPAPIVKYLPEVSGKPRSAWSMRDSNISPDVPTAAKQFESMYDLLGEGIPFDGIIYIDTQVVEELIEITGPVDIFGTKYSAERDGRCNCPNVIYELEHYAEVASKGEEDRKAILGTLMQQILAKMLSAGPDKLPIVINNMVKLANDKHIMVYLNDSSSQAALSKLNWTGQIKPFDGDYLHINDSNFAGGKSNLYVEEKVTLDIKAGNDGATTNKVTIEYKNPQPFNTWLNGILRDYVRIYVPRGAKLVSSKGSDDPVTTQVDEGLNKTYFEAFVQVRPQNSRTLQVEYTLPDNVAGKNYPLLIQKQPGAKDFKYTVKINGSTKAQFDLSSDKNLDLPL